MNRTSERKKWRRGSWLWAICVVCAPLLAPLVFGVADVGASVVMGRPLFSKTVESYFDGGSTLYSGMGYRILCTRKISGERGPVIWFRFVPVDFCLTTKHVGVYARGTAYEP
jgi:hypothetical protein